MTALVAARARIRTRMCRCRPPSWQNSTSTANGTASEASALAVFIGDSVSGRHVTGQADRARRADDRRAARQSGPQRRRERDQAASPSPAASAPSRRERRPVGAEVFASQSQHADRTRRSMRAAANMEGSLCRGREPPPIKNTSDQQHREHAEGLVGPEAQGNARLGCRGYCGRPSRASLAEARGRVHHDAHPAVIAKC